MWSPLGFSPSGVPEQPPAAARGRKLCDTRHVRIRIALWPLLFLVGAGTGTVGADPPPLVREYADLTLRYASGAVTVTDAARGRYDKPTRVVHWTGRFEARPLGRGAKELDRFRFDFPLLGDADPGSQAELADELKKNTVTTTKVRVPLPDGTTELTIADRHGGPSIRVALPTAPAEKAASAAAPPRDAGAGAPRRP